jgi:hypothetical protein
MTQTVRPQVDLMQTLTVHWGWNTKGRNLWKGAARW